VAVIATLAARAALAAAAIAAVALLVRRRALRQVVPPPVEVVARAQLGAGVGVALVEAGGRRLLVGWGKDGARLLRDLGAPEVRP
jgi:hypothetical protein